MFRTQNHKTQPASPGPSPSKNPHTIAKPSYKIVIEQVTQQKKKLLTLGSLKVEPPPGYTFIAAGDPQLTAKCKELARLDGATVYVVSNTRVKKELSNQVHRVGWHFPSAIVARACMSLGIDLSSSGHVLRRHELWPEGNSKARQSGQKERKNEIRLTQIEIDLQAESAIRDLFPAIPEEDLVDIVTHAFELGTTRVGAQTGVLSLPRRVQLAVVAHIRHNYTDYDRVLKMVPWQSARSFVEQRTLDVLAEWRGEQEDEPDAMEEILREVIVIPEDDDEAAEGKLAKGKPGEATIDGEHRYSARAGNLEVVAQENISDATEVHPIDYSVVVDDDQPESPYDEDIRDATFLGHGQYVIDSRSKEKTKLDEARRIKAWEQARDRLRQVHVDRNEHHGQPLLPPKSKPFPEGSERGGALIDQGISDEARYQRTVTESVRRSPQHYGEAKSHYQRDSYCLPHGDEYANDREHQEWKAFPRDRVPPNVSRPLVATNSKQLVTTQMVALPQSPPRSRFYDSPRSPVDAGPLAQPVYLREAGSSFQGPVFGVTGTIMPKATNLHPREPLPHAHPNPTDLRRAPPRKPPEHQNPTFAQGYSKQQDRGYLQTPLVQPFVQEPRRREPGYARRSDTHLMIQAPFIEDHDKDKARELIVLDPYEKPITSTIQNPSGMRRRTSLPENIGIARPSMHISDINNEARGSVQETERSIEQRPFAPLSAASMGRHYQRLEPISHQDVPIKRKAEMVGEPHPQTAFLPPQQAQNTPRQYVLVDSNARESRRPESMTTSYPIGPGPPQRTHGWFTESLMSPKSPIFSPRQYPGNLKSTYELASDRHLRQNPPLRQSVEGHYENRAASSRVMIEPVVESKSPRELLLPGALVSKKRPWDAIEDTDFQYPHPRHPQTYQETLIERDVVPTHRLRRDDNMISRYHGHEASANSSKLHPLHPRTYDEAYQSTLHDQRTAKETTSWRPTETIVIE